MKKAVRFEWKTAFDLEGNAHTYLLDPVTPESRRYRDIENHYHLCSIAENTRQIGEFQAASLRLQAAAAVQTDRALTSLACDLGQMNHVMERMSQGLESLRTAQSETTDAVHELAWTFTYWLSAMSEQMVGLQKALESIADTLRKPLETTALELRRHADVALKNGMRAAGTQRMEWYGDAANLLQHAVENPVGRQDYVAWFQIGWLRWKSAGDLRTAAEAFARAARLASATRDLYYVESLRHLGYVKYLRGDMAGANEAAHEALAASDHSRVLFDAARYAAVVGNSDEASVLLDKCLRKRPTAIITMLSEADFHSMADKLDALVRKLTEQARRKAHLFVTLWGQAIEAREQSSTGAGRPVTIPPIVGRGAVSEAETVVKGAGYLDALHVVRASVAATRVVLEVGTEELTAELASRQKAVSDAESDVHRVREKGAHRKYEAQRLRDADVRKAEEMKRDRTPTEAPDSLMDMKIGCGVSAAFFVVVWVGALIAQEVTRNRSLGEGLFGFAAALLCTGWLLAPLLHWLWYGLRRSGVATVAGRRSEAAESQCASIAAEVEAEVQDALVPFEARLAEAEKRRCDISAVIESFNSTATAILAKLPQTARARAK